MKQILRWLKTVSSTFEDVDFDGSLLPFFVSWCHNHGIKKLHNHWWTRLSNYNIKVAQKPHQTIGNLFPKPKDPVPKDQTRGAIYSCKDCDKSYIGETKRKFSTRLKEHQKAVEHKHSQKSALAEHCLRSGHTVSWEASKILRTSANWRNRRMLEAWEINTCRNPLNRDDGMHLPHEFLNLALRDRT